MYASFDENMSERVRPKSSSEQSGYTVRVFWYSGGQYVSATQQRWTNLMNVLKPHSRQRLTIEERIFNYRLSSARRRVERAFGILVAKWSSF